MIAWAEQACHLTYAGDRATIGNEQSSKNEARRQVIDSWRYHRMGLSAAGAFVRKVQERGHWPQLKRGQCDQSLGPNARSHVGDAAGLGPQRAIELAPASSACSTGFTVAGGSGRKHGDGPLHEISDEGWTFTLNLNLTSLFYSNRAAVRQFLKQETEELS